MPSATGSKFNLKKVVHVEVQASIQLSTCKRTFVGEKTLVQVLGVVESEDEYFAEDPNEKFKAIVPVFAVTST